MGNLHKQKEGVSTSEHWSEELAEQVIAAFPDKKVYTCAAGISPSGVVHFGNFRDVITSFAVACALQEKGKKTRLLFSWDDFDRFRKVPEGIEPLWEKYIGMPLSAVPDPSGKFPSYAKRFETEFESAMKEMGIDIEYISQTEEYQKGRYDEQIIHALKNRERIAEILLSFMTEKGKEEKKINPDEYKKTYYPISVYSRFTGKDSTRVISWNGDSEITYECFDSGKTETINIRKEHIVKLPWKVDWPMRWTLEDVVFEPGGHDHASPGGSFDVAGTIVKEVFSREKPIFAEYKFVGIQGLGTKMSGSKGNAISPRELLEIYEPTLLKWLYLRKAPNQAFSLAFDSEVIRQYDELDKEVKRYFENTLSSAQRTALLMSAGGESNLIKTPISLRQVTAFGQITQWQADKLIPILKDLGLEYDKNLLITRLEKAKNWLTKYNPTEMIKVREEVNREYGKKMTEQELANIFTLKEALEKKDYSVSELEKLVYDIPKDSNLSEQEIPKRQRAFFKDVYNLIIGSDTGPRLSTFLHVLDKKKVIKLLSV